MGTYQPPSFRKTIVPWYDSSMVCGIQIAVMILVFLFGCLGISVASEVRDARGVLWVPTLLAVLSLIVLSTTLIRVIRRRESI